MQKNRVAIAVFSALALVAVQAAFLHHTDPRTGWREMEVTVTAYTSTPGQTQGDPYVGAWNNRLTPGERAIAVSRDLLRHGLENGEKVWIEGFDKPWEVRDKMNRRYERRIDLYFGDDYSRAREFGRQTRTIRWTEESG
ncbi:3D domain-containing protein [Desulfohalovibrio reitneri]|uniref:3D domain-containing protein n=1 Tax=Desulfohalovibrio reitneri TaxID=1307759 RepID=UPI0004A7649F|nr:3D domain-containing protein [Desulfohalovibrio reitneri]